LLIQKTEKEEKTEELVYCIHCQKLEPIEDEWFFMRCSWSGHYIDKGVIKNPIICEGYKRKRGTLKKIRI